MAGNLRRAAEFVEMNLSQMGKDERRTRIGYKDQVLSERLDRVLGMRLVIKKANTVCPLLCCVCYVCVYRSLHRYLMA